MKVDTDKRYLFAAAILTVAMMLFTIMNRNRFFDGSTEYGSALFFVAGFIAILTGMFTAVKFRWKGRIGLIINLFYFFVAPILSMLTLEALNGVFIYNFSPRVFTANYIIYLAVFLIVYTLTGNIFACTVIIDSLLFTFGVINYYVQSFRGSPIVPFDLITISTGLKVSNNYEYHISWQIVLGTLTLIFSLVSAFKFQFSVSAKLFKIVSRIFGAGLSAALILSFVFTDIAADNGFRPDFWDQGRGYKNSGTMLNFCLNTKYLHINEPDNYDADDINKILSASLKNYDTKNLITGSDISLCNSRVQLSTTGEFPKADSSMLERNTVSNSLLPDIEAKLSDLINEQNYEDAENYSDAITSTSNVTSNKEANISKNRDEATAAIRNGTRPNIICIMNESLSDLSTLGPLETNIDYMPFIHGLTDDTIKGNLYVPVNGAGTSNTEFEFLTGNSLAFLPSGSNVYQLYIDSKLPSIVSTLMSQGYSSAAFHPYYASGWNRDTVYPLFGFEDFVSIEDLISPDILTTYQNNDNNVSLLNQMLRDRYPGKNMLLRRYISDSYDYRVLTDMYDEKDSDRPMFVFNVTMQNHGGYMLSYPNFYQQVHTSSMSESFSKADRYLSLVYESDMAFKELVEYFQDQSEPTLICMFGDHQPYLENDFFEELIGSDLDKLTLEQTQSRYCTPFVIWANYDIEEEYIDRISSNYLSTLVLETAGVELTPYNKYLSTLYQTLPVIDSIGYIDTDGVYYSYDDKTKYSNILKEYEKIQYNNLFDNEDRVNELFYLSAGTTK